LPIADADCDCRCPISISIPIQHRAWPRLFVRLARSSEARSAPSLAHCDRITTTTNKQTQTKMVMAVVVMVMA
jgi:hypothetical protein